MTKNMILQGTSDTIFCKANAVDAECELYKMRVSREGEGLVRASLPGDIAKLKAEGVPVLAEDSRGVLFRLKPERIFKVSNIICQEKIVSSPIKYACPFALSASAAEIIPSTTSDTKLILINFSSFGSGKNPFLA